MCVQGACEPLCSFRFVGQIEQIFPMAAATKLGQIEGDMFLDERLENHQVANDQRNNNHLICVYKVN